MNYAAARLTDPVARLAERLARGEANLEFDTESGYLRSLLNELDIDVRSQTLVFSLTSAQVPYISPETPRALYYNDAVYIGWPQGAPELEIASMDPNVGPVFYSLSQDPDREPRFVREMDECLRCHDSYSLTGGGVPRFIVGSGYTGAGGEQVTHEGWFLVDDRMPLRFRWGGWYVTGTHGNQTHMGNWIIRDPARDLADIDLTRTGNVTELSTLIDTTPYPDKHSDIVALLVLDHQVGIQNLITRVHYDAVTLLEGEGPASLDDLTPEVRLKLEALAEPLVEALLMVDAVSLTDRVQGTSGFADAFTALGPFDAEGRTLRELDLERRLFRYPCSYLVYSDAFDGLPQVARQQVFARLRTVLTGEDTSEAFTHLSAEDRTAILEILRSTRGDRELF
jgi:hypothetical protein